MGWILRMRVPAGESERVTSELWDLHPGGVAEINPASGGGPDRAAGEIGEVELLVGFDTEADARAAVEVVAGWPAGTGRSAVPTVEPVDDSAWVDTDRRVGLEVADHRLELEIGAAFGDGGHPSTGLALGLLAEVVTPGDAVLDVGTGTAILALAARALGAGPVTAVDNDPQALAVAARNLNRHPALAGSVELSPVLPATGMFDVVVANVVLGAQRDLAPGIRPRLAAGGTLVLAGVLVTQEDDVCALHPGLAVRRRRSDHDWLGLALRAP